MPATRINFTSIPVEDQDRALAFFTQQLGFEVGLDAPYSEGWRWIFLTLPGAETRLHFAKRSELTWTEGMPALALVSDDVDADAVRLKEAGVEIVRGPEDTPWTAGVRYLLIRDSEGNVVFLESLKKAAG